jgi:FAD/FMN-containing dehydrogenase
MLGGGVGWLGRRYGLASNSVRALELVTADGRELRTDHDSEPDLFWAMRGGCGNFGVVTAIEFDLYPVREVYAGWLVWPMDRAGDVLHRFREWVDGLPVEFTTSIRLLHLPPLPEVPEPLRDNPVVAFDGAYVGTEADGAKLLEPLREVAQTTMDTFAMMPAPELRTLHGDPEQPVPGIGDHALLRELRPETIEALVEVAGPDSGSPLLMVELRHLGGAFAEESPKAGALAKLDGDFLLWAVGMPMDPALAPAILAHLRKVGDAMAPWVTGGAYLNFAEQPGDTSAAFPPETFGRMRDVKRRFDPDNLFRSNHPVPAAG